MHPGAAGERARGALLPVRPPGELGTLARHATRARTLDTALATALGPLAALVYTADRAGMAMLDVHGQLLAPTTGLFPPAACAAMALASLVARRPRSCGR